MVASVRSSHPKVSRRMLRRWLKDERTWDGLVEGGAQAYAELVTRLQEVSRGVPFARPLGTVQAESIVQAAVASFLGVLPPADAVNVADFRASTRSQQLQEHLDRRFDSVEDAILQRPEFGRRVAALPLGARTYFATAGPGAGTTALLEIAEHPNPRQGLVELTTEPPVWLLEAQPAVLCGTAELCRAHGVHLGAALLFERASDVSPERAYLLARAALEYSAAGDDSRASDQMKRAESLDASGRVVALAAGLRDEPDKVLESLSEPDALKDPYLTMVRLYGLRRTAPTSEVIQYLEKALECYPDSAGMRLELGRQLLGRSFDPGSTARSRDRQRAHELALEARELKRSMRLPSADAAFLAIQSALLAGDPTMAIQLGTAPPSGEALPIEAADPDVRLAVAQAAVLVGRIGMLEDISQGLPEGFHRAVIYAETLSNSNADEVVLRSAYDDVWALASEEEQRVLYWLSASSAGILPHGMPALNDRTDDVPLIVDVQLKIANGDAPGAIALLRSAPRTERTARALVSALLADGDASAAAGVLESSADRFSDATYLVRASEVLAGASLWARAAATAERALQRLPSSSADSRRRMHAVRTDAAWALQEWRAMAEAAQAWVDDLGPRGQQRWMLALARQQGGEPDQAWRAIQEPEPLLPGDAIEARVWVAAAARANHGPETARAILSLVRAYPDESALGDLAVAVFFGRGESHWGDLPVDVIEGFQDLLRTRSTEYSDGDAAGLAVVHGDAQSIRDALRPELEARARAVDTFAERVQDGWPYGALSTGVGSPYVQALLQRAAGCLPIATPDEAALEAELAIAIRSLASTVVVDASTVAIGGLVQDVWPTLRGNFSACIATTQQYRDAVECAESFKIPIAGSLFFDVRMGEVVAREADSEVQASLRRRAEWLVDALAELDRIDRPKLELIGEGAEDGLTWLSVVDLAKAKNLPLWVDDLGLRSLAAQEGVPAFGTYALLTALASSGAFEPDRAVAALRELRQQYVVDLPLDLEWLRHSAAKEHWMPGPSAFFFSRARSWRDAQKTYAIWSELVQAAGLQDPIRVAGWVHAASEGLVRALPRDRATEVLAALASKGAAAARFDSDAIGACLARVREVATSRGIHTPVPAAVNALYEALTIAAGPAEAARILLGGRLDALDRDVVRELVLGPGDTSHAAAE